MEKQEATTAKGVTDCKQDVGLRKNRAMQGDPKPSTLTSSFSSRELIKPIEAPDDT
jgi:hypothetical protein